MRYNAIRHERHINKKTGQNNLAPEQDLYDTEKGDEALKGGELRPHLYWSLAEIQESVITSCWILEVAARTW